MPMLYGNKQYKPYAPLYPTPEEIPLDTMDVTISIPANPAWLGLWIGVLLALCDPESFQVFDGGLSRETTAEIWLNALVDALTQAKTLPAPFWDDPEGDDAGNPEDNPEFPFYEDVANFLIAGFVLYATGSPTAALEYWTIARQFRIQYRKNPLGGLIKIILDGVQVGEVDTYAVAPELGYIDVMSPGTTLRLEFPTEGTVTQLIRKRLWEDEIIGDDVRYNDITDVFERRLPDGTWTPDTAVDPRYGVFYLLPLRSGTDIRCNAAVNIRDKFERIVNSFLTAVAIADALAAIGAIIAVFAPAPGLFVELILALIGALVAIGVAAIVLAFDGDGWDVFQCIVYEEISNDGTVTQAQKDAIYTRVQSEMSATQFAVISLIINMLGEVGMTNAGSTGNALGTCDSCQWCYFGDFTISDEGWYQESWWGGVPNPNYTIGTGWESNIPSGGNGKGNYIGGAIPTEANITQVAFTYIGYAPVTSHRITLFNNGAQVADLYQSAGTGEQTVILNTNVTADEIWCQVGNVAGGAPDGNAIIKSFRVRGAGANPYGVDNCP